MTVDRPTPVTATQLAEHLGLTRQRIGVLADVEHVIERLPTGRFDLDAGRRAYLSWLRDPARRAVRSEAASEHARMKTLAVHSETLRTLQYAIDFPKLP